MADTYKCNYEGISSNINVLKTTLDDYKEQVSNLIQLINEIESSSSWKDESVKTSFIRSANSYINLYKKFIIGIESLINYLTKKSEEALLLEEAYAKE